MSSTLESCVSAVIGAMGTRRFTYSCEKDFQVDISRRLDAHEIPHRREVRLSPKDIIDFIITTPSGDLGLEAKIAGGAAAHTRQLQRYAATGRFAGIALIAPTPIDLLLFTAPGPTGDPVPLFVIPLWKNQI